MRQVAGLFLLLGIATPISLQLLINNYMILPLLITIFQAATYHCGKPVVPMRNRNTAGKLSNRIVGGWEAAPHSIPWQVRVKNKKTATSFFACGGSLIQFKDGNSTDLVLTAAHCFEEDGRYAPVSSISVIVGAHDLNNPDETTSRTIQALQYMHKNFESRRKENDIALVRLEKAVVHSKATIPVCLPKQGESLPFGKMCFVSGWGSTSERGSSSTILRQVEVEILNYDKCYKKLDQQMYFCAGIMAGGKDSCQGDSGGPLVCDVYGKFVQYGIISHGSGCARAGTPGVYTALPQYVSWLQGKDKAMGGSKGSVDPMKEEPSEKQPIGGRGPTNSFTMGLPSSFGSPSFPSMSSLSHRPFSSSFPDMPNDISKFVNRVILMTKIDFVAKSFECGKPAVKSARHGPIGRKFNRIVGGYEATPHSLPWQVRVLRNKYGNMYSLCGGSLIQLKSGNSTDLVLTAAHCLEER
ncbi:Trypsin domain containing protein [Trichuris trichiura]|uniref:Trypsin domain containing protein n=1 Tax=Trichuris trichiura TaxID=36087 RepID=A0A077ZHZ3_TRITR|nr:Trypsin domain containing protein [Trichuris trichiura]